jgi:hypothetical protein
LMQNIDAFLEGMTIVLLAGIIMTFV